MEDEGVHLALAAPHADACEAGREAFVEGGTAVDAALAACATLAVVYPHMCGLGGDLIALLHAPDGAVTVVNASGAAPANLTREVVLSDLNRTARDLGQHGMPVRGPHTATVPGAPSGWASLHKLGGALEWERIFRPAIGCAASGMRVSRGLAAMFAEDPDLVLDDHGLRSVFAANGRLPVEDEVIRQPALAASLKILAHDGVDAFYRGPLGAAFIAGMRAAGSLMTVDDLAAHEPELAAPLTLAAFGHEFVTAPPNSQGFVLLELMGALAQLEDAPLDPAGPAAAALAMLFGLASADRDTHLCDPRAHRVPLERLLGTQHLADLARGAVRPPGGRSLPGSTTPSGDTIACVAADSDGWAVSIIQSLYYGFGSGILEPATGIVAHDRGACFSLDPDSPNVLEGGKRPLHTLMPVLVRRDGRLAIVAGTMGGEAQPQIHAQILSRLLRRAHDPRAHRPDRTDPADGDAPTLQDAVATPRWIYDDGHLLAEADVPDACREALQASGLPFALLGALDDSVGHAQYVMIHEDGRLEAGSDPRADGGAVLAERP